VYSSSQQFFKIKDPPGLTAFPGGSFVLFMLSETIEK
jgi:hypothetical protein